MNKLELIVNGRGYGGWKSVRVTRSIEAIAGSFELGVSDRWSQRSVSWPIIEEDECRVVVDGVTLITGYVDKRSISYGAEDHSLSVSGRDRAGALVDCSVVLKRWEFLSTPLLSVAKAIAGPFGISVRMQAGVAPKPVAKLAVDPGDKAFDVLERATRMAGLLLISDGVGGIRIERPGSARTATDLVEGQNIKSATAEYDASGRYRRYVVSGQQQGSDDASGEMTAAVRGEAQDAGVRRAERVLLIRPEGGTTNAYARSRAAWEASVRAARGDTVTVVVQGWKQHDGSLWPVNAIVRLRSPMLGIDGDRLITQTDFSLDDATGTLTTMTLRRPDAFVPEPVVKKAAASGNVFSRLAAQHGVKY